MTARSRGIYSLRLARLLVLVGFVSVRPVLADVVYPAGTVVVDVTQSPYNADPTGVADSTAAIQLAINRASQDGVAGDGIADDGTDDGFQDGISRSRPRVIYFPNGVYRITNSLVGTALNDAQAGGLVILQGQSRIGSILRLDPSAAGFGSASTPKPVFTNFIGNSTNNAFMNGVENLTIEVGAGNPGAIALQFGDNNCGYVRSVTLRSLDPAKTGVAGLDLSPGTSATNPSGIGLIQDVAVEGFEVGISTPRGLQMPWVLDRITLSAQTTVGILNANRPLTIRSLQSTNTVPAIRTTGASAHVVLLDSTLTGGASGNSAVDHQAGHLFMRNVSSSGYAQTLSYLGVPNGGNYTSSEFVSGPVLKLWDTTPSTSLNLPIEDAPAIPWDAPADWIVVPAPTNDPAIDRPALQAALNSGKSSIVLTPGSYAVDGTLTIGPNVRRILGNWSTLRVSTSFKILGLPIFEFGTSNHSAVMIEKLQAAWNDGSSYMIRHNSASDLILRDIFWVAGPVYRNVAGAGGRLFLENIHSLGGGQTPRENRPAFVFDHQDVWARQINPEMQHPHIVNDGGKLVILGFKTGEQRGPVVITKNGGFTEILGGLQNQTHDNAPSDPEATTLLEIDNANVSAVFLERFEGVGTVGGQGWGNNAFVATETRGGETRTLRPQTVYRAEGNTTYTSPVPQRAGQLGSVIPLFVGYQNGAGISARLTHLSETADATPAFTVSRDSPDTSQAQTLFYTVSGTAQSGTDFAPLSGSITIPAGSSSADIAIDSIDHPDVAPARTLTLTLSPNAAYSLGTNISAEIQIVTEGIIAPSTLDVSLPASTTQQQSVTLFNPEATPVTYTVTGINAAYSVSHRDYQTGDTTTLGPGKTEAFVAKPQDDSVATINLPFAFPFYGATYNTARINTNGMISFNPNTYAPYTNRPIPSTATSRAAIAYYWDDLYFDSASKFYYQSVDTDLNGTVDALVLEIIDATTYATRNYSIPQRLSAQVWLFRDGTIRITYISSTIAAVSYTIGIQNWDQNQGVSLIYDGSNPSSTPASELPAPYRAQAGTTVTFHPPKTWVSLPATTVTVPANGQANFLLNFSTTGMSLGQTQAADLLFASSEGTVTLPVSLHSGELPTTPVGFSATASDSYSIALSWTDTPNETAYRIETSADGVNGWTLLAEPSSNTTTATHTALSPSTTHFYRIRSTNANGTSAWSSTISATTPALPTPPAAASDLTATAVSGSAQISLSWNDNSANETGFRVQRSTDNINFSDVATVPGNITSHTDSALAVGTVYFYRIIATNAVGDAAPSNTATAATAALETLLDATTATWLRGNTAKSPSSTATLSGTTLSLTSGGSNTATDAQTPFWAYFDPVTLADGETLRLSTSIQFSGTLPNVGQGFTLGLANSNTSRSNASVAGNNPVERRDDAGYGFTFGLGGSTTTRYVWKPAANNTNGPWQNIDNSTNTLVLGSTTGTLGINDNNTRSFLLEISRTGDTLAIAVAIDGVLYDGGRTHATPETFTFDSIAIVLRREGTQVALNNLRVDRERPLTPAQQWLTSNFGSPIPVGSSAWDADPDGDGLTNLLEYALGGEPLQSGSTGILPTVDTQTNHLTLSLTPAVVAGLTYHIEASPDLSDWSDVTDITSHLAPGQSYTHTDSADLGTTPRRFLRLRILLTP